MTVGKPWRTTFWASLSPDGRDELTKIGYRQQFPQQAVLLRQDDPSNVVMILLRGCVKVVSHKTNGYEAVLALRDPGDLIGEVGSIDGLPRSANVQAIIPAETLTIPVGRFAMQLRRNAELATVLQQCLAARLREADWQRTCAVSSTVRSRLADLLLDLSQRYGEDQDNGHVEIDLPLSQDDLAGFLSVSRRTVSRTLERWREANLIGTGRRSVLIKDRPALVAFVNRL